MAIRMNGKETFAGCVIAKSTKYWFDGMTSEYAHFWNPETRHVEIIEVGYYGCDGCNLAGASATPDLTMENARAVLRSQKRTFLLKLEKALIAEKRVIRKGDTVEVVRGRKVPKGTALTVFWVGERETYQSARLSYRHDPVMETIVGGKTENGEKVYVKAEYCKVLTERKSRSRKERKTYLRNLQLGLYGGLVADVARG